MNIMASRNRWSLLGAAALAVVMATTAWAERQSRPNPVRRPPKPIYAGPVTPISGPRTKFVSPLYVQADGAIALFNTGVSVDPYFSTLALLMAKRLGMDTDEASRNWIKWALPWQLPNGSFQRYCRKPGENWKVCNESDADDSMLALWLELTHDMAPDRGLPIAWKPGIKAAKAHLASLRDPVRGVYWINRRLHVSLFMDNVEVYGALRAVAQAQRRFRQIDEAKQTEAQAAKLKAAIKKTFWVPAEHRYRISTQNVNEDRFYPERVAQIYPLLIGLPTPDGDPKAAMRKWLKTNRDGWFGLGAEEGKFLWGLVAVAAYRLGAGGDSFCWAQKSNPFRYSKKWTVLEEAIWQGLQAKLPLLGPSFVPCTE